MRQELSKEKFIGKIGKRIARREELLRFYNTVFLPTLKKYDGKVYNKRFINELQQQAPELMHVASLQGERIGVSLRESYFSYNASDEISLMVKLSAGRISYEQSTSDCLGRIWIANFLQYNADLRSCIDTYDKYMERAMTVQKALADWSEVPTAFRENIHFYLKHYLL